MDVSVMSAATTVVIQTLSCITEEVLGNWEISIEKKASWLLCVWERQLNGPNSTSRQFHVWSPSPLKRNGFQCVIMFIRSRKVQKGLLFEGTSAWQRTKGMRCRGGERRFSTPLRFRCMSLLNAEFHKLSIIVKYKINAHFLPMQFPSSVSWSQWELFKGKDASAKT